jgi:3-oxoacyl-[acyl-carrier protein] reductase
VPSLKVRSIRITVTHHERSQRQGSAGYRQFTRRELGPVELLVANAGGSFTTPGPIEQTSEYGWHASIDGNLTATFLTVKSFLPGMKERQAGNIITIASAAGRRPHSQSPIAYSVAKAAIELL